MENCAHFLNNWNLINESSAQERVSEFIISYEMFTIKHKKRNSA